MAELADALDSKSSSVHPECGFESHLRHLTEKGLATNCRKSFLILWGGKFYTEFYISGCVPSFPGFSESVGLGLSDSSRTFRAWAAARMAGLVLM